MGVAKEIEEIKQLWKEPKLNKFRIESEAREFLYMNSRPIEKVINDIVITLIPKGEIRQGSGHFYIFWYPPKIEVRKRVNREIAAKKNLDDLIRNRENLLKKIFTAYERQGMREDLRFYLERLEDEYSLWIEYSDLSQIYLEKSNEKYRIKRYPPLQGEKEKWEEVSWEICLLLMVEAILNGFSISGWD